MTANQKTVPLTLPDHVWGRLASRADHRGTSVADEVADAIWTRLETDDHDAITPTARNTLALHKLHRSNEEIAHELGISANSVAGILLAFGVHSPRGNRRSKQ